MHFWRSFFSQRLYSIRQLKRAVPFCHWQGQNIKFNFTLNIYINSSWVKIFVKIDFFSPNLFICLSTMLLRYCISLCLLICHSFLLTVCTVRDRWNGIHKYWILHRWLYIQYTPVSPVMDQLVPHTGKNILKVPALAVNTIFLGIFFVAVPCSFWFCCL